MLGWKKNKQEEKSQELEAIVKDRNYERKAVYSDIVSTAGFAISLSACDTFPYNLFLGLGLAVSGMSAIMGNENASASSIELVKRYQPVAGTLAAVLSAGYYFIGDTEMSTIMGGLALACYSSTLSNIYRSKKNDEDPKYNGLVSMLSKNETD